MNISRAIINSLICAASLFAQQHASADPIPRKPDLIISEVNASRGLRLNNGTHMVPVTFKVTNRGNLDAGAFYVQATYRRPSLGEDTWVSLKTSGRDVLIRSLRAGETRTVRAIVAGMRPETNPSTVTIHADSCIGSEFMPDFCNVDERNEGNNSTLKVVYVE